MLTELQVRQLNNMNAAAQRAQLGTLLGILAPVGDVYYLDPANGVDTNSGTAPASAFKTMEAAYDALTANQNDVLVYIAGATSLNLEEALVWSKSYTHLVGMCAPTRTAQRARIFQKSTLTGASPLVTVSGSGCLFKDLYIFQGVNDATSLINVSVTGGRNSFERVHFAGGGHATMAIDGGASLKLDAAEENIFEDCTIGVDTVSAGTGLVGLLFDSEAHRNEFYNCKFRLYAGNAGAAWVEVSDSTGIDRDNEFVNCRFYNTSATSLTSGFVIPAGMGAPRRLYLKDCVSHGAAKWDANDRGVLFGNMNAVTGADLSGSLVEMIS